MDVFVIRGSAELLWGSIAILAALALRTQAGSTLYLHGTVARLKIWDAISMAWKNSLIFEIGKEAVNEIFPDVGRVGHQNCILPPPLWKCIAG